MIITRPRRRVDLHALALDAPLPFLPTCAGMGLPWPSGRRQNVARETGEASAPLCTCGNVLPDAECLCADCDAFADATEGIMTGPR
jgi:hypothetical protein